LLLCHKILEFPKKLKDYVAQQQYSPFPIPHSPFAVCYSLGPRSLVRPKEQPPQPLAEIAPIIFAHGLIADAGGDLADARFKCGASLGSREAAGFRLADAQSVVARQTGFGSWPALSRYVQQLRALEGDWRFVSLEIDGAAVPAGMLSQSRLVRGVEKRIASEKINAEAAVQAEISTVAQSFEKLRAIVTRCMDGA